MFQTIFSIAVPLVLGGAVKKGKAEGDMEYEVENKWLDMAFTNHDRTLLTGLKTCFFPDQAHAVPKGSST